VSRLVTVAFVLVSGTIACGQPRFGPAEYGKLLASVSRPLCHSALLVLLTRLYFVATRLWALEGRIEPYEMACLSRR
jgi:hypothetical protein